MLYQKISTLIKPVLHQYFRRDLLHLIEESNDDSIFKNLYIERDKELGRLESIAPLLSKEKINLIVHGEAGVGKTHYLHHLISKTDVLEDNRLYCINLDYKKMDLPDPKTFLIYSAVEFLNYFKNQKLPLNKIKSKDLKPESIEDTFIEICKHFLYINSDKVSSKPNHLLLILDDMDYMEEEPFKLIKEKLVFFATNEFSSLVLSCRSPLYASIKKDPRLKKHFNGKNKEIRIDTISIQRVVTSRLRFILERFDNEKNMSRVIKVYTNQIKINKRKHPQKTVNRIIIDHILNFESRYLNFINLFSNGNIREMLFMSLIGIEYILENRKSLKVKNGKYIIEKKEILNLFLKNDDDKEIEILNLHDIYSTKKKNKYSLKKIILQALKASSGILSHKLIANICDDYNFNEDDVVQSIIKLASNEYRCLYAVHLNSRMRKFNDLYDCYVLSDRGKYYLESIFNWDSYLELYGEFGNYEERI